ncbi:hypothetical protein E2C01_069906 [Portunus trituberculatus]|uniref:Uncharacterized protein n=1 Tax=Portunus trituberculatus TaxID=210409 RepID=A0A5B7I0N1_PORTR|nr:hypothetical protein [Portunus trituberculatus]
MQTKAATLGESEGIRGRGLLRQREQATTARFMEDCLFAFCHLPFIRPRQSPSSRRPPRYPRTNLPSSPRPPTKPCFFLSLSTSLLSPPTLYQ